MYAVPILAILTGVIVPRSHPRECCYARMPTSSALRDGILNGMLSVLCGPESAWRRIGAVLFSLLRGLTPAALMIRWIRWSRESTCEHRADPGDAQTRAAINASKTLRASA